MEVEKKNNQEAIIHLGERVNIVNSPELKQQLQVLYDEGYRTIIVDLNKTKMIDSSCLGKLLMFQKKLKERQGELRIINVSSEYISKMFNLIQLYKVINIS